MDIIKTPHPEGVNKRMYFPWYIVFACSRSRYIIPYGIRSTKHQVIMSKIIELQVTVLDRLPIPVKLHTLHADAASQFNDARFQQLCLDKGIVVTMGAPWHQHQNGQIKRP